MAKKFLEIETKYDASDIDRIKFKNLLRSLSPKSFLYVESTDIYYSKGDEFIRYRMPPETDKTKRSELTFKKKTTNGNNVVRTEVNLRVDSNDPKTVEAFCEGLGYKKNFSVYKICDIYFFDDADVVFYTVLDENKKSASFLEIEVNESLDISEEQAREIIVKYEKLLSSLGLNAQKRMRRSLWEIYRRD
jgi:predicted adenylyl cyclase CyaB